MKELMTRMILFFALLFVISPFSSAISQDKIVINEIMYNPPAAMGSDNDYEWVELYNPSSQPVRLDGWTLQTGRSKTELSGTILPEGYAIIAKELFDGPDLDSDCFLCYYMQIDQDVLLIQGKWSYLPNTGATIRLCNPDESYCDEATYAKSMGAYGDGSSLERVSVYSQQWLPSTDTDATYEKGKPDGTPGRRNSVASSPSAPGVPEFSGQTATLVTLFSLLLAHMASRQRQKRNF